MESNIFQQPQTCHQYISPGEGQKGVYCVQKAYVHLSNFDYFSIAKLANWLGINQLYGVTWKLSKSFLKLYSCIGCISTLRPRHHGRHFPGDIFKCIFLNENVSISIKISLKFVSKVPINYIPALVQIMDWRRPGDKPLSEPMVVSLQTHICLTRPQWVNLHNKIFNKGLLAGYEAGWTVLLCWKDLRKQKNSNTF